MSEENAGDRIRRLEKLVKKLVCRISDLEEVDREKTCEIERLKLGIEQAKRDIFEIRNTGLFSKSPNPVIAFAFSLSILPVQPKSIWV